MNKNSIKEDMERLKLCSTNQCNICGRYEKEECMLERNRCEQHILSAYQEVLKENEELKFEERRRIIGRYGDVEIHDIINKVLSNDYIPIQKIKDKIERIQEEGYWLFTTDRDSDECVEVLQELLGGKEQNE